MINIIMGMHRSGTSAIAGLLHSNGIVMGEEPFFQPRPSHENPKGYFEDVRFREINDRVLRHNSHIVKGWGMPINAPYWHADAAMWVDATVLVRSMDDQYPMWGWKDPRNSLTWPFWYQIIDGLGLLYGMRVIATDRSYHQIARSMIARGNEGTEAYFQVLAAEYARCVRLARPDQYIHFDNGPETIRDILGRIDIPITDTSFLDPDLRERTP